MASALSGFGVAMLLILFVCLPISIYNFVNGLIIKITQLEYAKSFIAVP